MQRNDVETRHNCAHMKRRMKKTRKTYEDLNTRRSLCNYLSGIVSAALESIVILVVVLEWSATSWYNVLSPGAVL
jgi:hypothetical protein